jgi:hypothetical protein
MAGEGRRDERHPTEDGAAMTINQLTLTSLSAGMTRLRIKGGAAQDALYDLLNGYIDASGAPTSRYGTYTDTILPAGTIGLTAFEGKLYVFSDTPVTMTDENYVNAVLVNPNNGYQGSLTQIYFAKPFLGFLYVAAGFTSTTNVQTTVHYWLQQPAAWTANTVYGINAQVQPDTPNGFYYEAQTPVTAAVWQPNTAYTVGTYVAPSTANGYIYELTDTVGANPTSGPTEPTWPTSPGAQVFETVSGASTPSASTTSTITQAALPATVINRYGNSVQVNGLNT